MGINSSNNSPFSRSGEPSPILPNLQGVSSAPQKTLSINTPAELLQIKVQNPTTFDKKQMIQTHSILESFSGTDINKNIYAPDRQILANQCLSPASKGTELEGMPSSDSLNHFGKSIQYIEDGKGLFVDRSKIQLVSEHTKQLIADTIETKQKTPEKLSKDLTERLNQLKPNESISIPAGSGRMNEGHFMIVRFTRNVNQTFDLRVYNAQQGVQGIAGGASSLHKTKVFPYLRLSNVEADKLFFDDSLILLNLFRLKQAHLSDKTIDIYSFFAPLSENIDENNVKNRLPQHFISAQRSGNCTIKSFNCFMLDLMNDPKDYKLLVLENRFFTIQKFYHKLAHLQELNLQSRQDIFLLRQSVMSFLRMMNRCEKWMNQQQYLAGVATALDILEKLDEIEKKFTVIKEAEAQPTDLDHLPIEQEQRLEFLQKARSVLNQEKILPPKEKTISTWDCNIGKNTSWNNLAKDADFVLNLKNLTADEKLMQFQSFMYNIRGLKYDEDGLKKLTAVESQLLLSKFELMIDLFTEAKKKQDVGKILRKDKVLKNQSPAFQNSVAEVLALSFQLACHIDDKRTWGGPVSLKQFGLWTDYFKQLSRKQGFDITDPVVLKQRNDLVAFFFGRGSNNFNFSETIDEKNPIQKTAKASYFFSVVPFFRSLDPKTGAEALKITIEQNLLLENLYYGKSEAIDDPNIKNGLKHYFVFNRLAKSCYESILSPRIIQTSLYWNNYSGHSLDTLDNENRFLRKGVSKTKISQEKIRSNLEEADGFLGLGAPDVAVMVMMDEIIKNPHRLTKTSERTLMNHFFHKTMDSDEKITSSLFDAIQNDPFFLDRLTQLQNAVNMALIKAKGNEEQRQALIFIYQFSSKCLAYFDALKGEEVLTRDRLRLQRETLEKVNELLLIPTLTESDRKLLLCTKVNLLLTRVKIEKTFVDSAEIFSTMCEIKSIPEESEDPIFEEFVLKEYFYFLPNLIQHVESESQTFIEKLFAHMNLEHQPPFKNDFKSGIVEVNTPPDRWKLDLTSQETFFNGYLINTSKKKFEETEEFKRLFPEEISSHQATPDCVLFHHKIWGEVRVFLDKDNKTTKIEKKIRGQWCTYASPSFMEALEGEKSSQMVCLNKALSTNHVLWIAPPQSNQFQAILCDLKSGKESYIVNQKGELKSIVNGQKLSIQGLANNTAKSIFESFDDPNQINAWEGIKKTVEFNRFMTEEGQSLQFEWNEEIKSWVYGANEEFILDLKSPFDWGIQQCIPLVSKDGSRRKVLIPKGEKIFSQSMSQRCSIQLPSIDLDFSKGTISYLELEVEKQKIQIKSLNEKLYLTGIYLAQKKYLEAREVLDQISQSEEPDAESWKIFEKILFISSGNYKDDSPNAGAIRLQSYLILKKLNSYPKKLEKSINFLGENYLERIYKNYAKTKKSIFEGLVLSNDEERTIKDDLGISQEDKLIHFSTLGSEYNYYKNSFYLHSIGLFPNSSGSLEPIIVENWLNNCSAEVKEIYEFIRNSDPSSLDLGNIIYSLHFDGKSMQKVIAYKEFLLICAERRVMHQAIPSMAHPVNIDKWQNFLMNLGKKSNREKQPELLLKVFTDREVSKHHVVKTNETRDKRLESLPFHLATLLDIPESKIQTSKLFSAILVPKSNSTESHINEAVDFFSKVDKSHKRAIHKHLKHYENDQKIDRNKPKVEFKLNEDVDLKQIEDQLKGEIDNALATEKVLKGKISTLIDNQPTYMLSAHHEALKTGFAKKKIKVSQVCQAATQENWATELSKLNRNLSDQELCELRQYAIEYMSYFTFREHSQNIQNALKEYLENPIENGSDDFFEKLTSVRNYKIEEDLFSLFFEYKSGLRLKSKQIHLIMEAKNLIDRGENGMAFQLIMAGGKTSVILSTFVEIFAEQGFLACVLSHHSQLPSLKSNLLNFQKTRFGKDVITLGASLEKLSKIDVLKDLLDRIERAKKQKCPLLMTSTFPQVLLAKFQMECLKANSLQTIPEGFVILEKIIGQLKDKGIAFIDECDSTLSMKTEVHLPLDKEQILPADESELVGSIYRLLISSDLRDKVGLLTNTQDELKDGYQSEVLPILAKNWLEDFLVEFELEDSLKPPLLRFLMDKIPAKDQDLADNKLPDLKNLDPITLENIQLLRFLESHKKDNDKIIQRKIQLLGVARHLFIDILPSALSRSFNRDYGPINGVGEKKTDHSKKDIGDVVPYLGVGTPATTKFGDPYLALSIAIQSALPRSSQISDDEISFLRNELKVAAEAFSDIDEQLIENTPEAKLFKDLTSVDFKLFDEESTNSAAIKQAFDYLNDPNHPERRISFRSEVAAYHVKYFPIEVCCTPIDLIEMFRHSIAFSGTLYNHPSYHKKLGMPILDAGTEGSILNRLQDAPILEVERATLSNILEKMKGDPSEFKKSHAIIDTGAFLKDINNEEAAKQILQECPHINAVIYLPNGETSFKMLKRGVQAPIKLENTLQSEIKKYASLDELFVLFDELRTTGTDIPLPKDAICFQTISPEMSLRSALQGSLRARKFFKGQKIRFLTTPQGRAKLFNRGKTFDDVSLSLQKNEAVGTSDQALSSYVTQFASLKKQPLLEKCSKAIQNNSINQLQVALRNGSDLLSTTKKYSNYEEWIRIPQEQNVFDYLKSQASFGSKADEELLDMAQKDDYLPDFITRKTAEGINNEIYIEQEAQVNIAQDLVQEQQIEVNLELQTQIDLELKKHSSDTDRFLSYQSEDWVKEPLNWDLIASNSDSVHDFFSRKFINTQRQQLDCSEFVSYFPKNLRVTKNLQYSAHDNGIPVPTSVFDSTFKETHFILFVQRGDNLEVVMLSKQDAAELKNYLLENPSNSMWLVNLNGNPTTQDLPDKLKANPDFHYGLWYANFFNGNVKYLEQQDGITRKIIESHPDFQPKYLFLKNGYRKTRLTQVINSKVLKGKQSSLYGQSEVLCSYRRKKLEKQYHDLRLLGEQDIRALAPALVKNITTLQVKWLVTTAQIQALPRNLIKHLTADQIQQMSAKQLSEVKNQNVISKIENLDLLHQLSPRQIKHVQQDKVILLKDEQLVHATAFQMQDLIRSDPARVEKIVSQVNKFQEWHIPFLSVPQIQKLRIDQPRLIKKLTEDQIPQLLVKQVEEFYNEGLLSTQQKLAISDEQFIELPDPIKKLLVETVSNEDLKELRNWHIPHLSGLQVTKHIDERNIIYLPTSLLRHLSANQVIEFLEKGLLNETQLLGLVPVQVEKCITMLSNQQIQLLGIEQFPMELPADVLSKFSLDKLVELENAPKMVNENVSRWSENAVLSLDQVQILQENHGSLFKYIPPNILSQFSVEMLEHYIQTNQIKATDLARFKFDQLPRGFPTNVIPLLDVNHLSQAKEGDWIPERLDALQSSQIQLLKSPDHIVLIRLIPNQKAVHFTQDQLKRIFPLLSEEQIKNIPPENIPEEFREHLKPEDIVKLSRKQIKALYGAKGFFGWVGHRVYGVAFSALSISFLPVQLAWNLFKIGIITLGTPFSANVRRSWKKNMRKTIANVGKRFLPLFAIFSYPRYLEYFCKLDRFAKK